MKNFLKQSAFIFILFIFFAVPARAEGVDVSLTIRDGSAIIFSGTMPLPEAGTVDLNDSNGVTHTVDAQSVLAVAHDFDLANENWELSDLTFFDSFGSFYIKCVNYSAGEQCDNWQYVVDGTSPFSSVDQNILSGGEQIYLYFGYPHQVVLSASAVIVNESFQATAQNYDYENNVWEPLTGVTLGATTPNPDDPFNPIEVAIMAVDGSGVATFSLSTPGSYNVGIKEDFYFPVFAVSVAPAPVASGGSEGSSGGGGRESSSAQTQTAKVPNFSVKQAVAYLKEIAEADGSFGKSDLYTDWAAVAYGASRVKGEPYDKIVSYLRSIAMPSLSLTDNERRAIALLALGQNPYSFGGVNYIELIVKDFDNVQFGEPDLVNDDVFALIILPSVGYTVDDEIISSDIKFILSEQKTNGSWEGSADLTAAAVQALVPFDSLQDVSDSISNAKKYLKDSQEEDGGWGSVYSTAWVLQAEEVLDADWKKGGLSGENYLGSKQESDGGVLSKKEKLENRIWATSYAIPGALGKPWSEIMHKVAKQVPLVTKEEPKPVLVAVETETLVEAPIAAPEEIPSVDLSEILIADTQIASVAGADASMPGVLVFSFGALVGFALSFLVRKIKLA
ncbi:MAG: prenyltransferase/squalene oxidase repeat-containing protein [Patescibacteria group bacterium]